MVSFQSASPSRDLLRKGRRPAAKESDPSAYCQSSKRFV